MNGLKTATVKMARRLLVCAAVFLAAAAAAIFWGRAVPVFCAAAAYAACVAYAAESYRKSSAGDAVKRANALERDMKLYVGIYEQSPQIIYMLDENFRMTDCNAACVEFMGADDKASVLEELTSKLDTDFPKWIPESGFTESTVGKMKEAASDGFARFETIMRIRDGTRRNVAVTFKKIMTDGGFMLLGNAWDITELRDAKSELARKNRLIETVDNVAMKLASLATENGENLLREAMEIMGRSVDADRIYIWKNRVINEKPHYVREFEWLKSSAYTNESLITKDGLAYLDAILSWEDILGGRRECVNGPLSGMSETARERLAPYGIKSLLVIPVFLKDSLWGFASFDDCRQERWFRDDEIRALRSGSLMIAGALARGGMERAAAMAKAVSANRAKTEFLSNISREMRAPMNAIIGMTSIGKSAPDASKKDYAFSRIENASKRLFGVINDVLDMSKIEADKLELSEISFSFENMLQDVANVINFRVDERKQNFYVTIDRMIPEIVIGDDQRLAQVITNLLANAVKFTPERGTVRLNARLEKREGDTCVIKTEVIGAGISEEQRRNLFKSLGQADSGTSRKFGGSGLGLANSKRIVEMMGGEVWIQSELGEGATFAFTVRMQAGESGGNEFFRNGIDLREISVLAANCEPDIMDCFRELTPRFGVRCGLALSDAEIARLIELNGPYSLYFIDWQPHGAGADTARRIRMADTERPIVGIISAADRVIAEDDAKEAGVDKFLIKPIFPSAIADVIAGRAAPEDSGAFKNRDGGADNFSDGRSRGGGEIGWKQGIIWNPALETGHEKIDDQHKELFRLTSNIVEACENGSDAMTIGETLDFLASYTVEHFTDEETLMVEHGYPGYADHKAKHDAFKKTVIELIEQYKASGATSELLSKINSVVAKWLITHISQVDRKLANYIKSLDSPK